MDSVAVSLRAPNRSDADRPVDADLPLIERIADGDDSAFESFVRRHESRMLGLCQRMLRDPESARDATQEVFLKVWRKAGGYRPRGRVSTWLYRIAVNHCLNVARRRKIVRMVPFARNREDRGGEWQPRDPAPGADAQLETRERWARTRRAIDRLPTTQRSVLVLAKFEGLGYREIAEVLGITVGAVESRLFRAMRNLERAASGEGGGA